MDCFIKVFLCHLSLDCCPDYKDGCFALLEAIGPTTAIQIPAGPDFQENHILGLAMDFTILDTVPHPNPEKEDLPGAPLLAVATTDGLLRFYRFGSTVKGIDGVIAPSCTLPESSIPAAAHSGKA